MATVGRELGRAATATATGAGGGRRRGVGVTDAAGSALALGDGAGDALHVLDPAPAARLDGRAGRAGGGSGSDVCVAQRVAAHQVVDDDPLLALGRVFEADDDHAVALRAFAPAVGPVFAAQSALLDQRRVAGGADVVVADAGRPGRVVGVGGGGRVAGAVEAGVRGWDRVGADVAVGCDGEAEVVWVFG